MVLRVFSKTSRSFGKLEVEMRKDQTHEDCRRVIEFYMQTARGRGILTHNYIPFNQKFIQANKLDKRFPGHSYDIMTDKEIIEIDDLRKHSKPNQKINDGIAEKYIKEYFPSFKFYRLLKEEIVDKRGRLLDPVDVANYLRDNLF